MKNIFILLIILVGAFIVRMYKIDNAIADWHSWRQADTASVTRVFAAEGINPLIPRFQDISSLTTGKHNPAGYRMVEYPIYNYLHLAVYNLHPDWGIDKSGRLTSVFLSLISLVFVYLITKKISSAKTALLAAFLFAFLPFNIYYSRVILPEPAMVTTYLISFYLFLKFIAKQNISTFIFSAFFMALSILIKPYAMFFILPYFYLAYHKWQFSLLKNKFFYLFIFLTLAPFIFWRIWMLQFPQGIPGSSWLFNDGNIRFRPAWFRWLFGERLGFLILGIWGTAPFVLGILKKASKSLQHSYLLWFIGIIAYFSVIAAGNIRHDYYQAIIMPFVAMLMARGTITLVNLPTNKFHRFYSYLAAIFITLFSIGYSWYQIKGYYQINNNVIVIAGEKANQILPPDARVIAPYNGDTAFLYQSNRYGWPIVEIGGVPNMVDHLKATHYISVNYDDVTNKVLGTGGVKPLIQNDDYVIIELRYPNP